MTKRFTKASILMVLLSLIQFMCFMSTLHCEERKVRDMHAWDFEKVPLGQIPEGWKIEGTNQKGPLAAWQVLEDESAPSGKRVLALTHPNHASADTFNLCWTDRISFVNGEVGTYIKSHSGQTDQGGGLIWRVKDKDNYYVARWNPLENNLRVYYVKSGTRKLLGSVDASFPPGKWIRMKIVHQGALIEGYLNDSKVIEVTDSAFSSPGGVGFWTKADASTAFHGLLISFK